MQEAIRRAASAAERLDWRALQDEAVRDLQTYLRFPTVNPPGNEKDAADWLAQRLRAEGIPADVEEAAPGRFSLLARLSGMGERPPIILAHHIDVVPPGDSRWEHDPFGGEIAGGEVWGRGALDDKGPGMMQVAALVALKRAGVSLGRDVILLAVADEETGGRCGMRAMLERHPELRKASLALIAEAFLITPFQGHAVLPIVCAEKGSVALRVALEGRGGHASGPGPGQPLPRLAAAMRRLTEARQEIRPTPEVIESLRRLGARMGGVQGMLLQDFSWPPVRWLVVSQLGRDPTLNAMVRNTVAWTGLTAGTQYNVVPDRAEATLDMRILPGTSTADALAWIEKTLDLPDAQLDVLEMKEASRTEFRTPWYALLEAVAGHLHPDAVVVPLQTPSATDARHLREAGIPTYVMAPAYGDRQLLDTAHGINERIPVAAVGQGARFFFEFLAAAAGDVLWGRAVA